MQKEIYRLDVISIFCIDQANIIKKIDTLFILNLVDTQLNYFNKNGYRLQGFKLLVGCDFKNLKNKYSYIFFKKSLENSFIYKLDLLILSKKEGDLEKFEYLIEKYSMKEHDIIDFQGVKNVILSKFFLIHNYNLKITKKAKINILYFYKYLRVENNIINDVSNSVILYSRLKIIYLLVKFALTLSRVKFQKNIKNKDVNEAKNILMFHYCNFNYHMKNIINTRKNIHSHIEKTNSKNKINLMKYFKSIIIKLTKEEIVINLIILLKINGMSNNVIDFITKLFWFSKNILFQ
mmetsp:Transcript_11545/g.22165  ORF Transcript_11545/g.22165 Transcript_11545/m.22165 type:complete len:292 (-) Transcript_11545:2010-2885(-)